MFAQPSTRYVVQRAAKLLPLKLLLDKCQNYDFRCSVNLVQNIINNEVHRRKRCWVFVRCTDGH